jgi:hypothetical protein
LAVRQGLLALPALLPLKLINKALLNNTPVMVLQNLHILIVVFIYSIHSFRPLVEAFVHI